MGNVNSNSGGRKRPAAASKKAAWGWEYRDGRAYVKHLAPAKKTARPLFRKQPSDNYDWWIFNPNISKSKRRNMNS